MYCFFTESAYSAKAWHRETETALNNLLKAIEQGIIIPTTKQRMFELEQTRDEINQKRIKKEMKKPTITKEGLILWHTHIQSMSLQTKEHKQRLIDVFVNAVYLYDDILTLTEATSETIESYLDSFLNDLRIYNIPEFNNIIYSYTKWKIEIMNSFDIVDGRRISNAPVESIISRIKLTKRNANGYTNFERFKKRILYSLNNDSFVKL